MTGRIRTGIAGWTFEPWRGSFYPAGLVQKKELNFASRAVTAIEIQATFRGQQKPQSFRNWAGEAPDDFVFPVKGPQYVTHILKLRQARSAVANFLASGPLALGARLGPFVWQLPPSLSFDAEVLEAFLSLLPQTPAAAASLAGEHDDKLKSEPHLATEGIAVVRHAIEARHPSFATPEAIAMLRAHNVALVIADTEGWPWRDVTADFVYCRLQGPPDGRERYGEADLDGWAARLGDIARGEGQPPEHLIAPPAAPAERDVFAIFVSHDKEHAPDNARALLQRLSR